MFERLYTFLTTCSDQRVSIWNSLFSMHDKKAEAAAMSMNWSETNPELIMERVATEGNGGPSMSDIESNLQSLESKLKALTEPSNTLLQALVNVIESKCAEAVLLGHPNVLNQIVTKTFEDRVDPTSLLSSVQGLDVPTPELYGLLLDMHRTAPYQTWCYRPGIPLFQCDAAGPHASFLINFEIVYMTDNTTFTASELCRARYPVRDTVNEFPTSIGIGQLLNIKGTKLPVVAQDGFTLTVQNESGDPEEMSVFDFMWSDPDDRSSEIVYRKSEQPDFEFFSAVNVGTETGFVIARTVEGSNLFYMFDPELDISGDHYEWIPAQWLEPVHLTDLPAKTQKVEQLRRPVRVPTGVLALTTIGLLVLIDSLS